MGVEDEEEVEAALEEVQERGEEGNKKRGGKVCEEKEEEKDEEGKEMEEGKQEKDDQDEEAGFITRLPASVILSAHPALQ